VPPLETSERHQQAVYWPLAGYDRHGEQRVGDPQEIDVRWEDRRGEMVDPQGNRVATDAYAHVDREIAVGSCMWKGSLADWLSAGSGLEDARVMLVVAYREVPDVRGRELRRTLGLRKYGGAPPA